MVHSRIEELKQKWFWYWSRAYISWLPHRRCNISMFCVSQFKSFNIYMYLCNVSFNTDASFVLWLYCVCEEKTHRLHMLSSHRVSWNLKKFLKICSNTICVKDAYHWPCCVWMMTRECWKHSVYYMHESLIQLPISVKCFNTNDIIPSSYHFEVHRSPQTKCAKRYHFWLLQNYVNVSYSECNPAV